VLRRGTRVTETTMTATNQNHGLAAALLIASIFVKDKDDNDRDQRAQVILSQIGIIAEQVLIARGLKPETARAFNVLTIYGGTAI
jgi:hypothetical protein